jgi:hypothetical protein
MEAIVTFEGTDSVQALIVGREITGLSASAAGSPSVAELTDRGEADALRARGATSPDPLPRLRSPHLDDGAADGQLHLPVELGRRPVRLDGVPGIGVLCRPPA